MSEQLPASARWLGLAGLLPALAGLAVAWLDPTRAVQLIATAATLLYGGIILSFIGGAWWGLASRASTPALTFVLILSVIPSLYAWPSVAWAWLDAAYAGSAWLLAFGFLLTLPIDRLLVGKDIAPSWWMSLRVPLSLGMAALHFALGARFFF